MMLKKKWEDLEKGDEIYQLSLETGNVLSLKVNFVNKYWTGDYNYRIVVKLKGDIKFNFDTNRSWDETISKNNYLYAVNKEALKKSSLASKLRGFNEDLELLKRGCINIITEKERLENYIKYNKTVPQVKIGDPLFSYNVTDNIVECSCLKDPDHIRRGGGKVIKINSIIDNYTFLADNTYFYTSENVAIKKTAIDNLNSKFAITQDSIDEIEKQRELLLKTLERNDLE